MNFAISLDIFLLFIDNISNEHARDFLKIVDKSRDFVKFLRFCAIFAISWEGKCS